MTATDIEPETPTDRRSFDELYRTRYTPMVRLAYVIVDSQADAEHVVQDAFVALYPRYDEVLVPEAYLRTSVVNAARKVLRRHSSLDASCSWRPRSPSSVSVGSHSPTWVARRTADSVAEQFCVTATELAAANNWLSFDEFPQPGVNILVPPHTDRDACPDADG